MTHADPPPFRTFAEIASDAVAGVVHAVDFGPAGREAAALLASPPDSSAPSWLHLDRTASSVQAWVRESDDVPAIVREALFAAETRPRADAMCGGILVNVRGVNLNPGNDPEDMIALRAWLEPGRLVSMARLPLAAVDAAAAACRGEDDGDEDAWRARPASPEAVLVRILLGLMRRAGAVADALDDRIDELEDRVGALRLREPTPDPEEIGLGVPQELRRRALSLRRWLAPQREVVARLVRDERFADADRADLSEAAEGFARVVDVLEAVRDRAGVLGEELVQMQQARLDRRVYGLTLVAAIFLPLGFVTGLLGINVGGMPGADSPIAFWSVTVTLAVLATGSAWLLKRARWF